MSEHVIGVHHKYKSEGLEKLAQTSKAYDALTASAQRFTTASLKLGVAGAAIAGIGYTAAKPLLFLKNVLLTIGTDFESMNIQMRGLMGGNQKAADEYFGFLRQAAVEIPYSFKEAQEAMKEFVFMGIDVKKQYDVKTVVDGVIKNTATGIQALSGLASASGTTLSVIGHDLQLAITQGRADYLSHWIGPLQTQAMQMSGTFIGTWQQQWDKAIKWIGTKYAQESSNLARSYMGLIEGLSDLKIQFWENLLNLKATTGAFYELRFALSSTFERVNSMLFITKAGAKGYGAMTTAMQKLSEMLSNILLPYVRIIDKAISSLTTKVEKLVAWATGPKIKPMLEFWGKVGLAGSIFVAVGALITFGATLVGIGAEIYEFVAAWGVISGGFAMISSFLTGPGLLIAGVLILIDQVFFKAEGSWFRFFDKIKTGFEGLISFFKIQFQIWDSVTGKGTAKFNEKDWNKLNPLGKDLSLDFIGVASRIKFGDSSAVKDSVGTILGGMFGETLSASISGAVKIGFKSGVDSLNSVEVLGGLADVFASAFIIAIKAIIAAPISFLKSSYQIGKNELGPYLAQEIRNYQDTVAGSAYPDPYFAGGPSIGVAGAGATPRASSPMPPPLANPSGVSYVFNDGAIRIDANVSDLRAFARSIAPMIVEETSKAGQRKGAPPTSATGL